MHDADMTKEFRDSLERALEQQREINARLDNLTAKLDQVIARNKTLTADNKALTALVELAPSEIKA